MGRRSIPEPAEKMPDNDIMSGAVCAAFSYSVIFNLARLYFKHCLHIIKA